MMDSGSLGTTSDGRGGQSTARRDQAPTPGVEMTPVFFTSRSCRDERARKDERYREPWTLRDDRYRELDACFDRRDGEPGDVDRRRPQ